MSKFKLIPDVNGTLDFISKEFELDQGQQINLANVAEQLGMSYIPRENEVSKDTIEQDVMQTILFPTLKYL